MFTALNLPVNYYLGSWYFDPKYALNVHEIIFFKINSMISYGGIHEYNICT